MTRVLVFNFFHGLKDRGIPLYARELDESLRSLHVQSVELSCPPWLRGLPTQMQNVAFVLFEQFIAPLARLRHGCDLTVYPYNSCGVIDSLCGRALLVVHDLIPNARASGGMASRYIRSTQWLHCRLGRPVAAVSDHTMRYLRRLPRFVNCPLYLWRNAFYTFSAAALRVADDAAELDIAADRSPSLLLCSGIGSNKDFLGALNLFVDAPSLTAVQLRIVGFGDDARLAERRVAKFPAAVRQRITVLPRLSVDDMAREYVRADLVWVHSRKEGYGRPVIEARLSSRRVVATAIGAFRQLRPLGHVYLYRDEHFDAVMRKVLLKERQCTPITAQQIHAPIEAEIALALNAEFRQFVK